MSKYDVEVKPSRRGGLFTRWHHRRLARMSGTNGPQKVITTARLCHVSREDHQREEQGVDPILQSARNVNLIAAPAKDLACGVAGQ